MVSLWPIKTNRPHIFVGLCVKNLTYWEKGLNVEPSILIELRGHVSYCSLNTYAYLIRWKRNEKYLLLVEPSKVLLHEALGCDRPLKVHYLDTHLEDFFWEFGVLRKIPSGYIKDRNQASFLVDYCWTIKSVQPEILDDKSISSRRRVFNNVELRRFKASGNSSID